MRGKHLLIIVALTMFALLFSAVPAFAGQVTHIYYGSNNEDYYVYTPTVKGKLDITISWTGADGTGAPVFPVAEVDGVVQTDNGTEPYADIDLTTLYAGTNPEVGTVNVTAGQVGIPIYVGAVPFIGNVPYRIVLSYNSSVVYDSGAIDITNPNQKWARSSSGEAYLPARGDWHSVLQLWNGSAAKVSGSSNWIANWDDYAFDRATYLMSPANNWTDTSMYPPVVTDSVLGPNPAPADAPAWYVICPEIWTSAKVPNAWVDPTVDNNPQPPATPNPAGGLGTPGSTAYTAAPAWYTYSFPDGTANASKPAYFINQGPTSLSAKGRYYNVTNSISEQIKFDFIGDSVKWDYLKGPAGAIINVSITGTPSGTLSTTVDQYNASGVFTSQSWTGLGAGAHTITLQSSGTHNASSTGFNFYHDAFEATTDAADVNLLADNCTDGNTWNRWIISPSNANFHGNFQSSNNALGATCAFTFQGTSVDLIYTKGTAGGKARVYIDGVDKGTVDMFNATPVFQADQPFTGLPGTATTWHTIFIKNDGTTSGTNYYIYIDAFKIGTTYYEDTP